MEVQLWVSLVRDVSSQIYTSDGSFWNQAIRSDHGARFYLVLLCSDNFTFKTWRREVQKAGACQRFLQRHISPAPSQVGCEAKFFRSIITERRGFIHWLLIRLQSTLLFSSSTSREHMIFVQILVGLTRCSWPTPLPSLPRSLTPRYAAEGCGPRDLLLQKPLLLKMWFPKTLADT